MDISTRFLAHCYFFKGRYNIFSSASLTTFFGIINATEIIRSLRINMHVRPIPYNEIRNFEIIRKMDYFRVRQLETFGSFASYKNSEVSGNDLRNAYFCEINARNIYIRSSQVEIENSKLRNNTFFKITSR